MPQSRTPLPGSGDRFKELVQTCQFDAGQLTSDGGLAWVQQADAALGLCAALAAQVPEWRRGSVRASVCIWPAVTPPNRSGTSSSLAPPPRE